MDLLRSKSTALYGYVLRSTILKLIISYSLPMHTCKSNEKDPRENWGWKSTRHRRISSMGQEMNDRIFNFDSHQRNVNWNGKRESGWYKSESLKPLLTLLRLSMAESKISLAECHIALETMWVIFKYLLVLISNIIPQW